MSLESTLRENLLFKDFEKVMKFIEKYKIDEALNKYIEEELEHHYNLKCEVSELGSRVQDLEDSESDLKEEVEKLKEELKEKCH